MDKQKTLRRIKDIGLLAVIRGSSEALTLKAIDALVVAGVQGIEITFSTPNACSVVKELSKRYNEEILLGMGTITKIEQVSMAIDSGAEFLVSPMFDEELTNAFVVSGLVNMVASFTTSEIFHTYQMGADIIKIFPGRLAGPNYIKDLRGPFPEIPFMPTGGVDKDNVSDWFKVGVVAVGAGSSLCPKELVKNEEFGKITRIAKEFVKIVNAVK